MAPCFRVLCMRSWRRSVEGARQDALVLNAQRSHQTLSDVRPCSDVDAKERRCRFASPVVTISRNSRSIGRTPEPLVDSSPWHASKKRVC